jgi:hypothetical protein
MKDYSRVARKIPTLLFVVQSLGSAGFIAAFTHRQRYCRR